ncbi:MBL fold metallo-hydrolase [Chryseobacterium sp. ERMR1:04]|uniref:MBL fold metallo-hydrolase n=1 Tax=Chryseobacterium sp. ERMR1:04 TaxID=1705393 RepID=UPI0006C8BEE7|nr:MBL fold metallo-hydrolase [Chryseobacterium sp. ERMR1:04]KPH11664.1 hypothetical protein AMQ68_19990 [Chryseobacterium sp. ERMR1:04]
MLTVHLLPALYGDTILIDVFDEKKINTNILIDCGFNFESEILPILNKYHKAGKKLDRFIITHYDDDHINSAAKFIKENGSAQSPKIIEIDQVWLNAYKHLQFEKKKLPVPDENQLNLLRNFIALQKVDTTKKQTEIGAKQASKLGKELLSQNYSWNEDFNGKAVCIEYATTILLNDNVLITLVGPNKQQLTSIDSEFKKALKSQGIKVSDTHFVDDAFELFLKSLSAKDIETYSGVINGSVIKPITSELIKSNKSEYKPDKRVGNGSSISFILNADGKKILMLADAHAEPVIERLKRLYPDETCLFFDAIKVSHHGSFGNNPKELYELIDSANYLISTNGSHPSHMHPDIETIAFIINRPLRGTITKRKLIFNYFPKHLARIFDEDLMKEFNYTAEVSNELKLP